VLDVGGRSDPVEHERPAPGVTHGGDDGGTETGGTPRDEDGPG
jgi:hypothetical protein